MKIVTSLALLAALAVSAPAFATLGAAPLSSASRDVTENIAVRPATAIAHSAYTVQESTLANGDKIREFIATSTHTVFAVVWRGPSLPDMTLVLGDYFTPFKEASRTHRVGQHQFSASTPEFVVESGGRRGNFGGRAILAAQLPAGISLNDIK